MDGWTDEDLFRACAAEGRALVSFDLDFANPLRFDPADNAGVIVLRPGTAHSRAAILGLLGLGGPARHERPTRLVLDRRVRACPPIRA